MKTKRPTTGRSAGALRGKTHLLVGQGPQLRTRSPERVRQEAWGLMVMYNLVRLQMLRLAHQPGVPARRLSPRGAALLIGSVWASAWLTPPGTIGGLMSEMQRNLKQLLLPARTLTPGRSSAR